MLQLPVFLEFSMQNFPQILSHVDAQAGCLGVGLRIDISSKFQALLVLQNTPHGKIPTDFD